MTPALVREQADGLRSAGVDAEDVHVIAIYYPARPRVGICHATLRPSSMSLSRSVASRSRASTLILVDFPRLAPLHARDTEVRALWVVRTTLTSPAAIATMVSVGKGGRIQHAPGAGARAGRRVLSARLEPRPPSLGQPAFDPLADHDRPRPRGRLRVHAWVNVNWWPEPANCRRHAITSCIATPNG